MQFSVIIKPLFESFKGVVSTSSLDELHRTALSWLDEHCSLPILRPSEWGLHGERCGAVGGLAMEAAAEIPASTIVGLHAPGAGG